MITKSAFAVLLFVTYSGPKTDLHDWFESLKNAEGTFCCAEADGVDVEYGTDGSRYTVETEHGPVPVDDGNVLKVPNRHGHAMAWFDYRGDIRCFIPGSGA